MVNRTRSVAMVFRFAHFGNEILAHRLELGLTQDAVGNLIGTTASTIGEYERGKEPNPKMQNFLALCNLYDIDPRGFFELES